MSYIYQGMGWILKQLYTFIHSVLGISSGGFALAIVLFTILINAVFLPLNIRQQKTTAKQTALRPKLDALKEKCGNDRQKYNAEMQALYQREGVKMMGGCLPSLIRLPFLWGVWQAIRQPLQYIIGLDSATVDKAKDVLASVKGVDKAKLTDLDVISNIDKISGNTSPEVVKHAKDVDFNLFGLNLADTPHFGWNFAESFTALWIFPILSFATAMLSSIVMMKVQKKSNPDANTMGAMMLLMPILSLIIAFGVPAAVGFYWACSNVVTMIITLCVNKWYGPYKVIAREEAKLVKERRIFEKNLKINEQ